jgi:pyrroloquinoline quinone biosynthesis protein B
MSGLRAIVLGAAAGGGFPQWNCRCAVCALAWAGDPRVRPRTQSSLAITGDGATFTLLNASPDLRQQIIATPALHPQSGLRHSPIGAVVLTNGDVDHVAGLLTLRERQKLTIHATATTRAVLAANPIFDVLAKDLVEFATLTPEEPATLPGGVTVTPFAVPGKVPLYLEGETVAIGTEDGSTIGLIIEAGGKRIAHVPGCAVLTDRLFRRLATADLVFFDGTLFTDTEMVEAGLGTKTGRRMGHVPVDGEGGSLPWIASLPGRVIYLHINNTNPMLIEGSAQHRKVTAAGLTVAHDGLEVRL